MAAKLGWVNVDEMLSQIPMKFWYEWIAYQRLDPFTEERADIRAGHIIHRVHNANFKNKLDLDKCIPKFTKRKEKRMSPIQKMKAWFGVTHNK